MILVGNTALLFHLLVEIPGTTRTSRLDGWVALSLTRINSSINIVFDAAKRTTSGFESTDRGCPRLPKLRRAFTGCQCPLCALLEITGVGSFRRHRRGAGWVAGHLPRLSDTQSLGENSPGPSTRGSIKYSAFKPRSGCFGRAGLAFSCSSSTSTAAGLGIPEWTISSNKDNTDPRYMIQDLTSKQLQPFLGGRHLIVLIHI